MLFTHKQNKEKTPLCLSAIQKLEVQLISAFSYLRKQIPKKENRAKRKSRENPESEIMEVTQKERREAKKGPIWRRRFEEHLRRHLM